MCLVCKYLENRLVKNIKLVILATKKVMSESILKALMRLFAIIASFDNDQATNEGREIVKSYLKKQLSKDLVEEYIQVFDEFYAANNKRKGKKKLSSSSVKVLMICEKINEELRQEQKILVLLQLIEFISYGEKITDNELEFVKTVADIFNIPEDEYSNAKDFLFNKTGEIKNKSALLLISEKTVENNEGLKHIQKDKLDGEIYILNIPSTNTYVLKYYGSDSLSLNGHHIKPDWGYIFDKGASIRSSKISPIYYSDIVNRFLASASSDRVVFEAKKVDFKFKNSPNGIQEFNFHAEGGELIGVMGGSGAGKSTLLNVFNGSLEPQKGEVLINGYNVYTEKEHIEGVIGFIPQDDLLIEELTVYQNLFYSAKLCFRDLNDDQIAEQVEKTLHELDLYEIRDLKVGDPLNKFISGGQRKRLNIALELIREASVMFVDEPTSGLSSMDSEMVMDLLKEQTLKGKLAIVNIHQPSSDIYKMFDKLLIMDKGGHPIYYGNPVDAIVYFKKHANYANADESECHTCGNVNPEQVLQIIESKVVDEYGKLTRERKIKSSEWYTYYRESLDAKLPDENKKIEIPANNFKIPSRFKQFLIYITRDVLSKVTNKQYLLLTFFEAPVLALILGYFTKYVAGDVYVFGKNENFTGYIFMSVVVALFIGLTVSAEEIIKDRKILKREVFLNLSRFSYINSKVVILLFISAIQAISFVVVGNLILGVEGMMFYFWAILFTTFAFANILGLNISSSLNSVVTIYILIPFILVPQLLLSGLVVKFDKLHKSIASAEYVPFVGDVMTSRWAYEAIAVTQFVNNEYETHFFKIDKQISDIDFIKGALTEKLLAKTNIVEAKLGKEEFKEQNEKNLRILKNEITKLKRKVKLDFPNLDKINPKDFNSKIAEEIREYLHDISVGLMKKRTQLTSAKDKVYNDLVKEMGSEEAVNALRDNDYNNNLADVLTNKIEMDKIKETDDELIQISDPIFKYPNNKWGRAHFYAPVKRIGNKNIPTFIFNISVIWLTFIMLYIFLIFDVFRQILEASSKIKIFKK